MASLTRCDEVPDTARRYRPPVTAASAAAETDDLDTVEDEFDVQIWLEDFRQGSSEIDLCGRCGRPTGLYFSLGEWVDHPIICSHCLAES